MAQRTDLGVAPDERGPAALRAGGRAAPARARRGRPRPVRRGPRTLNSPSASYAMHVAGRRVRRRRRRSPRPGRPAVSSRWAVFTTSPITVGSPPARMAPTSTSPVLTPTRICDRDADLGRDRGQRLLHPQRGAHRPFGVVLVGDRGAEERDDLVADDLVEPASEGGDVDRGARSRRSTTRLTCSGSTDSENAVKPTRSAISTVTRRRSSGATTSRWPHSGQKRAPRVPRRRRPGRSLRPPYRPRVRSIGVKPVRTDVQIGPLEPKESGTTSRSSGSSTPRSRPRAEQAPRVDAGFVAVVPAQRDAPAADELGAGRGQRLRCAGLAATRGGPAPAGPGTRRTGS